MTLLTEKQLEQLRFNGRRENQYKDHMPVAKLYVPNTGMIILVLELQGAFAHTYRHIGLTPGFAHYDLQDIANILLSQGMKLENDPNFSPKYPISVYIAAAESNGKIIEDEEILIRYCPIVLVK